MPGEAAFGTKLLYSDMDTTRTIVVADPVTDSFEIAGNWTTLFRDGVTFRVVGGTGNNGTYTCDGDSTYSTGTERTTIMVAESVSSATAGGRIEYWEQVASVVSLEGPAFALDTVDVTAHDSPDAWEEVVPTVPRTGEITLEINYDPTETTHDATHGLPMVMKAQRLIDFEMVFPIPAIGGTTWEFAAYVTGFSPRAPHDDKLSASVALKLMA